MDRTPFGGLISSRCTNEDLYVFQKFMRLVIGTNQIDSSARYGHVNGMHALRRMQGTHRWTVTFEDILAARRAAPRRHQHHGDQSHHRT